MRQQTAAVRAGVRLLRVSRVGRNQGLVVDILRSTSKKQLRLAASPRDHLADDFRHQGIRQDYRKARRVRQLPAMRFDESDAVEKQRFGAPTHKRNASCGDDVQCVRIGARRRKGRWALERFPFVALGRDLRGDRNEDAEPAIARETGDGRRDVGRRPWRVDLQDDGREPPPLG
jgi:hypothetical protein